MAHPLDGARLKIILAQEHLKAFNEEGWRYVSKEPYEVVTKLEGDRIGVEGIITSEPPPGLACIVGDFVTNCRAALDYVAWELVTKAVAAARITLTDGQKRRVTFPIVSNQATFAKKDGTADHLAKVCGVPPATMSVIESVQPYHAGYEPLDSLDLLVRTDKHRTLLLCGLFMQSAGSISIYRGDKLCWTASGMTRMEMSLAAFGPSFGTAAEYNVKVDEKPTVLVSLKDFPSPGVNTWVAILENVLKCTTDVVRCFESLPW